MPPGGYEEHLTNLVNGKRLIGQSSDIYKRWGDHQRGLKYNKHENNHLQNAYNIYGENNFSFDILLQCKIEELDNEEIRFISEKNTLDRDFGYNLMSGGNRPKMSNETKKKISESLRGEKSYMFGKHLSKKVKDKKMFRF